MKTSTMKTTATMTVARKRPCRRHCIELLSFCSADEQLLQVISERKREREETTTATTGTVGARGPSVQFAQFTAEADDTSGAKRV